MYAVDMLPVEFWERVDCVDSGCWEWTGGKINVGYGSFRRQLVHRLSYEEYDGPIPDGYVIHHLCHNRICLNPEHLIAITRAENTREGALGRRKSHCSKGHEYTPENTINLPSPPRRDCRQCQRDRNAAYRIRLGQVPRSTQSAELPHRAHP